MRSAGRIKWALSVSISLAMSANAAWAEAPLLVPQGGVQQVVHGELQDVARALRGLDQSYAYRGMVGCGAATAGSVNIDWVARGVAPEHRFQPLPPQPLVLSQPKSPHAAPVPVQPPPVVAPTPHSSADMPALPIQPQPQVIPQSPAPVPATAPIVSSPCHGCGTVTSPVPPTPIHAAPPVAASPPVPHAAPAHHCPTCDSGIVVTGGVGGRTPPGAVLVNGYWVEAGPAAFPGYHSGYSGSSCGVRVW